MTWWEDTVVAVLAAANIPAAPILALMAIGVLVAIGGHATKSRSAVVTGLTILFLATGGMMIGGFAAFHTGENDPRPGCPNGDCRSSAPDPGQRVGLR
jgi:hypothetical protein